MVNTMPSSRQLIMSSEDRPDMVSRARDTRSICEGVWGGVLLAVVVVHGVHGLFDVVVGRVVIIYIYNRYTSARRAPSAQDPPDMMTSAQDPPDMMTSAQDPPDMMTRDTGQYI